MVYSVSLGWVDTYGNPLKSFDRLPMAVREAWAYVESVFGFKMSNFDPANEY